MLGVTVFFTESYEKLGEVAGWLPLQVGRNVRIGKEYRLYQIIDEYFNLEDKVMVYICQPLYSGPISSG